MAQSLPSLVTNKLCAFPAATAVTVVVSAASDTVGIIASKIANEEKTRPKCMTFIAGFDF
jgi:hypothetical protein